MENVKYLVYTKIAPPKAQCKIEMAQEEDYALDGFCQPYPDNRGGYSFHIYNTLEEALLKSGFALEAIDTSALNEEQVKELKRIAAIYIWIPARGYLKRLDTQYATTNK